jgi:hypothetical protein
VITEYKLLLRRLGYDVESKGAVYFLDLIDDVRRLLNEGYNADEVKELLPRYYLENYHFYYEVGRYKYMGELEKFCSSRVVNKKNSAFNRRILKSRGNMNIEDSLIFFAEYFNKLEQKEANKNKVYVFQ